jgi:protein GON7
MTGQSELYPQGEYRNGETTKVFSTTDTPISQLTTNGQTTGPSEYVLNAGIVDKDRPSEFNPQNPVSVLRARLTVLQDEVNGWLTEEMQREASESAGNGAAVEEIEKKLLDGADSDSDEE